MSWIGQTETVQGIIPSSSFLFAFFRAESLQCMEDGAASGNFYNATQLLGKKKFQINKINYR